MQKSPYSAKFKYDREKTIYGVVVNETTGKHYCFNRDYLVLPVQFPPDIIREFKAISKKGSRVGVAGHGKFRPADIGDEEQCRTYFLFNDENPPNWAKQTISYDKSVYEGTKLSPVFR